MFTSSLDLNDPNAGWSWSGGRVNLNNEKRVTEAGRLRADLRFGDEVNNLKVGVAHDRFYRTIVGFDNSAEWQANVFETVPDAQIPNFLRPGPYGFITVDFDAFMRATDYQRFFDEAPEVNSSQSVGAASGGVNERNFAAYVEVNGETEVWNRNLRFNAGVRYVDTDQEISGPVTLGADRQWQTLEGSYDEWLPSMSLRWDVADDWVLRMSSSRTLTRPNPRSMRRRPPSDPSAEIADQGNRPVALPVDQLRPGPEWYTGDEGMVALTLFKAGVGLHHQGSPCARSANSASRWMR